MTLEPVDSSHLFRSTCTRCPATVFVVPEQADIALCIECGRAKAGVTYPWFVPFGDWHPTVGSPPGYPLGGCGGGTQGR